jgi:hypothetical protein
MKAHCNYALCCVLVRLKTYVLDLRCNIDAIAMITYFVLWCYPLIQGMAQIHRSSAFSKKAGRHRYAPSSDTKPQNSRRKDQGARSRDEVNKLKGKSKRKVQIQFHR